MLQPGVVIGGRFRVDRVLGAGGMGVVVQATHTELGQQVALKVLHDELAANPTIVARFLREAKAVATLRTEHVCRVFDVGRLDSGAPFIVMEMLEGTDLTAAALKGVPMTIAVEYVIQACVALAEAHAAGLVHRDIKPPNLFVVRKPDGGPLVKVLDFGIAKAATAAEAKLTHTTSTMGSPGYMSPEQIRSTRDVDLRTDIWALGVTLYQLLSGRMPFGGTQLAEIAVAVMTAAPPPLQVDPKLAAVVMRCLEKEPERRYANVAELAVALMPFGGPSAPRFVREITRGAVGGDAAPAPAIVPQHAPTAASLVGMTQATGVAEMTAPPVQHAPPQSMPHGTSPALAAGTSPHAPAVAAPSRKGTWIAVGVVIVVVLVGGGALAGYLARGGSAKTAHDAGVAIGSGSGSGSASIAIVAPDAAVVAAVDAGGGSGDPWNSERPSDPLATGGDESDDEDEDEDAEAVVRAQMDMARSMLTEEQKKQTIAQLRQMEKALEQTRTSNPALYQQQLMGFISAACYMGEIAMANRMFDKVTDPTYRQSAVMSCKQMGVAIGKAADKKM
ncbi:MAG: serine/threonine-protein kinase [Kofleriaceae bacterium]